MDDLISRQDAIDAAVQSIRDWDRIFIQEANCRIRDAINELPSAQPERKEGKWIPVVNGRGGHECNQCHEYAPSYKTGEEHLSDFCPECGAKMKGAI